MVFIMKFIFSREYEDLPQEAAWETQGDLDGRWPGQGDIQFNSYSTKYRPELDTVLNNFNLKIKPGEKVGLVGRTGAGKSSLSLAMFRIIEAVDGNIKIDNRDVSTLGLQDLRSRLTIIPQEPTIFSGRVFHGISRTSINHQLHTLANIPV